MGELTMNIRIEPEDIANRVLDEVEYKGRTIREWADCLSNPKNNADRIRAMSDEELEWAIDPAIVPPGMSKREWLQQPAEA